MVKPLLRHRYPTTVRESAYEEKDRVSLITTTANRRTLRVPYSETAATNNGIQNQTEKHLFYINKEKI